MSDHAQSFFGQLFVNKVENLYPETGFGPERQNDKESFSEKNVKTVHYPDCQQLILWLPEYYAGYDRLEIKDAYNKSLIYVANISDIISGSVQIILDTLFLYPGEFVLLIYKEDQIYHKVLLHKYKEGEFPEQPDQTPTPIENTNEHEPIIYKDGFGNMIPNEDLILRDRVIKKTINKVFRRLEFISYGRDGKVIYMEGDHKIEFYMEMGGYNCVFYLNIPPPESWEKETAFPLSERDEILQYVAEGTLREQAPSCHYRINQREISFYKN